MTEPGGRRPRHLDPTGGPQDEPDPDLEAIRFSLEEGLIYIDDLPSWLTREDTEIRLGAEAAAELAEQQRAEWAAFFRRRAEQDDATELLKEADDEWLDDYEEGSTNEEVMGRIKKGMLIWGPDSTPEDIAREMTEKFEPPKV